MVELDRVLHQPIRTKIMAYLAANGAGDFNTLKKVFNLSDGHMTTHMRELLENQYIAMEKEVSNGKARTVYFITDQGKQAFAQYVEMLKEILLLD